MIAAMSVSHCKVPRPRCQRRHVSHHNYPKRPEINGRNNTIHGNEYPAEHGYTSADRQTEPGDQSSWEGSRRNEKNNSCTAAGDE